MANRIFYQQDCDLQKLSGKTVAITATALRDTLTL